MCLYSKTGTFQVLKEDLICYKVVILRDPSLYRHSIVSPFQKYTIKQKSDKISEVKKYTPAEENKDVNKDEYPYKINEQGHHLLYTEEDAIKYREGLGRWMLLHGSLSCVAIAKCKVPASATVFDGMTLTPKIEGTPSINGFRLIPCLACSEYEVINYEELEDKVKRYFHG